MTSVVPAKDVCPCPPCSIGVLVVTYANPLWPSLGQPPLLERWVRFSYKPSSAHAQLIECATALQRSGVECRIRNGACQPYRVNDGLGGRVVGLSIVTGLAGNDVAFPWLFEIGQARRESIAEPRLSEQTTAKMFDQPAVSSLPPPTRAGRNLGADYRRTEANSMYDAMRHETLERGDNRARDNRDRGEGCVKPEH